MQKDIELLRELSQRVKEISLNKKQDEKKELWRKNNSLQKTVPPVIVSMGWWDVKEIQKYLKLLRILLGGNAYEF